MHKSLLMLALSAAYPLYSPVCFSQIEDLSFEQRMASLEEKEATALKLLEEVKSERKALLQAERAQLLERLELLNDALGIPQTATAVSDQAASTPMSGDVSRLVTSNDLQQSRKVELPDEAELFKESTQVVETATTTNPDGTQTQKTTTKWYGIKEEDPQKWFLGGGIGTRVNLSGTRVIDVKPVVLPDGTMIAQIAQSDEAEVRLLLETHYIFEEEASLISSWADASTSDSFGEWTFRFVDTASDLLACGLWSFLPPPPDNSPRRGCGPFVALAFDVDASPEEFALGHMISFESPFSTPGSRSAFNLGYGIIIDPDSQTLDNTVLVEKTYQIRPEFVDLVATEQLSLTQKEETLGAVIIFSTNF